MEYRKRMYDAYASTRWRYTHSQTFREYEYLRMAHRRVFMSFLPEDKEASIIDLACGSGRFLYFLQKEGYHWAQGIDVSQEMIDLAKEMGVENVEVGDLFQILPHHKEEFDFISANDIIEHLKKDEVLEFLDLVYAALKPSGGVLIMTPNAASLLGSRVPFHEFTHETCFTEHSLAQVLRVCRFENVAVYGMTPVVLNLSSGIRAILWKLTKGLLKAYLAIEGGISYRIWREEVVLERRMFAVGRK